MMKLFLAAVATAVVVTVSGCATTVTRGEVTERISATKNIEMESCYFNRGKMMEEANFPHGEAAMLLRSRIAAAFTADGYTVKIMPCTWVEYGPENGTIKLVISNVTEGMGGWIVRTLAKKPPERRIPGGAEFYLLTITLVVASGAELGPEKLEKSIAGILAGALNQVASRLLE